MNTIPFGPRNPSEDPLLAKAAALPKDVEPPHDLWPGIAARLGEAPRETRPRGFRWPMALAAGFLVASVSALLTWSLVRAPDAALQRVRRDAAVTGLQRLQRRVAHHVDDGATAQFMLRRDAGQVNRRVQLQLRRETLLPQPQPLLRTRHRKVDH